MSSKLRERISLFSCNARPHLHGLLCAPSCHCDSTLVTATVISGILCLILGSMRFTSLWHLQFKKPVNKPQTPLMDPSNSFLWAGKGSFPSLDVAVRSHWKCLWCCEEQSLPTASHMEGMGRRSVGWVSLYRQETRISSPALDILPTCLNWLVEIHWGILLLIGTGKSYCKWGRRALEARWCCSAVLWGTLQFALTAWEPSDFPWFRSQVCSFRLCGAQLHLQQQRWVCRWWSHQATVLFSARAGFRSLSSVLLCFYRDVFGNLPREWLGKIKNHLKMQAAKKILIRKKC